MFSSYGLGEVSLSQMISRASIKPNAWFMLATFLKNRISKLTAMNLSTGISLHLAKIIKFRNCRKMLKSMT